MVEFIKRSKQTATNQPIGVVRITNDDGGMFRARMAMAQAVQGVTNFSIKKVKEQYEQDDIEAAASQPIYSRNEDGKLEPNSFEKAPGLFGIGERERATVAQNLYNKRFAISTENAMNTEALNISNTTKNAEEFRQQFEAYTSTQLNLLKDFSPILQAQYEMAAADVTNKYMTGKLKNAHIKAEQIAVADLNENVNDALRDVQTYLENGELNEANLLLGIIQKNVDDEFKVNNQFTVSLRNNIQQESIRAAALGTILNIKQTPNVDPLKITMLLDKGLRDGSYTTEEFGEQLIESGLSAEQAVRIRTVFSGATTATENNIAQVMSAIKDEEKFFATTYATNSALESNDPLVISGIPKSDIDSLFNTQVIAQIASEPTVMGQLSSTQQNLVNVIKSTRRAPAALQSQVEDILSGAIRDENTIRNVMSLMRYASFNEEGRMAIEGVNDQALGVFFAAVKVNGGDFMAAQEQTYRFATAPTDEKRKSYAKILQRFSIPTDELDYDSGTLKSKGMSTLKEALAKIVSEELGGSAEDYTNQRMIDNLVPAALQVYSTHNNPDLIMKEYIRGNFVKSKYLYDEVHSEYAPERHFQSEQDEQKFIDIINKKIASAEDINVGVTGIPVSAMPLEQAQQLSEKTSLPIDFKNVLGQEYFLLRDASSTVSQPKYYIVDQNKRYVQSNGQPMVVDFRMVAANNNLVTRSRVNKSIQDAARLQRLNPQLPSAFNDVRGALVK